MNKGTVSLLLLITLAGCRANAVAEDWVYAECIDTPHDPTRWIVPILGGSGILLL